MKRKTAEKPKSLTNSKQKSRQNSSSSKPGQSRYKDDDKIEEEKILTSPIQENVPTPTQETSNCQLLSKEFDKLIEHTTSHDLKGSFKEESKTEVLEDTFAVVKMDSAQLFAWGSNRRGQICTGRDFSNDPIPVSFDAIKNLLFVACGHAHTIMVSELGQTFAMGDNSKCQLGLPPQTKAAVIPQRLENIVNPSQIACGAATSYVVAQGKLYSWGEAAYGALGSKQALQNTWKPIEVKIDKHIKHISAGDHHTAAITVDDQMYVWGANSFGQLGLKDTNMRLVPTGSSEFQMLQVTKVSCGQDFTFVITKNNEILVTGKLPFTIEQLELDQSVQVDCVTSFQSVAQFENGVEVMQIEASKFAAILVKPGEAVEPKELFMWGQTPLGLFQEPTSLNQLVQECQDGQPQVFDVKAVKTGGDFLVFVDEMSGLTYQLGTEDLKDPYTSQGQVSLSELRDVKFTDPRSFACGSDFIIGSNGQRCESLQHSPKRSSISTTKAKALSNGLQCITEENPPSAISSASKLIKLHTEQSELLAGSCNKDDSVNLCTPRDAKGPNPALSQFSEHSFRQDALFKDDLSLTPVSQLFPTETRTKQLKCDERKSSPPSDARKNMTFKPSDSHRGSGKPPLAKREESEEKMLTAREHLMSADHNNGLTPRNCVPVRTEDTSNQVFKTANDDFKRKPVSIFTDARCADFRKLDYSLNVSPITRQSMVRDSIADLANAMYSIPMASAIDEQSGFQPFEAEQMYHQPSEIIRTSSLASPHAQGVRQIEPTVITSHGPLFPKERFQPFQRNQQSPHQANPLPKSPISNRYMPHSNSNNKIDQYLFCSARSSIQPTNLNAMFLNADAETNRVVNVSNLDQSIYQLELESMLVKDKVEVLEQRLQDEKAKRAQLEQSHKLELEQSRAQVQELGKQIEKSARDYQKLMGKIDEDSEETAQLREKVRSQTSTIENLTMKQTELVDRSKQLNDQKERLEAEVKETVASLRSAEEQVRTLVANVTKECTNEKCLQRISELEDALGKKGGVINDLARQLGALELQNKELLQELKDRNATHTQRIDDLKAQAKSESAAEQEKTEQLQREVDALKNEIESLKTAGAEKTNKVQKTSVLQAQTLSPYEIYDVINSSWHLKTDDEPRVNQGVPLPSVQSVFTSVDQSKQNISVTSAYHSRETSAKVEFNGMTFNFCNNRDNLEEQASLLQMIKDQSKRQSVIQEHKTPVKTVTESNTENGCLQASANTARRLRQQRMQKDLETGRAGAKSANELARASHERSLIQESSELIVQRQSIDPSRQNHSELFEVTDRSTSRLRQPTPIAKSQALRATLESLNESSNDQQENTRTQVVSKTLTKSNSNCGLTSRQTSQIQTMSQSNLKVSQESQRRHKTPNQSQTCSLLNQSRNYPCATPKQSTLKMPDSMTTPRMAILGPPMNLATRLGDKSNRCVKPENAYPRFTHSASSSSIGMKKPTQERRTSLMTSKYATDNQPRQTRNVESICPEESEHMIDLMVTQNNLSRDDAVNRSKVSEADTSMHSTRPRQNNSPMISVSVDVKNVLQDSTNGLSSMKDKLKAIQDNKHMLEQKIQEYEKKLKNIQKKGKRPDENSASQIFQAPERQDKPDRQAASRKTPCYRECMMQNTPQMKLAKLYAGAATSSRMAGHGFQQNN